MPLAHWAGSKRARSTSPLAPTAAKACVATVRQADSSTTAPLDGVASSTQPISCCSPTLACSSSARSISAGAPVALPARAPPQVSTGALLSNGSRTRTVAVWLALKPSASVAVTRSSIRPGAAGTRRTRPRPSSATGVQSARPAPAPRIHTWMLVMGLKLSARTVATTVWPGSTGVSGVVCTMMDGALASALATTRSVKASRTLLRPSLTWAVTMKSPTWPGPGVQRSTPAALS